MVRTILSSIVRVGRGSLLLAAGPLLAASAAGCAEISYGSPEVHDTILRSEQAVAPGAKVRAEMAQAGTNLRLSATQTCDIVEMNEIRRTSKRSRENDVLAPELVLLGMGATIASFGVLLLVDSQSVHPDDRNARLYNATGPGGAIAGGVVLTAVGGIIMTVPLIDAFRTIGSETDESVVREKGAVLQENTPCQGIMPASNLPVTGRLPNRMISLGTTDHRGRLTVDLVRVVPPDVFQQPRSPDTVEVWIDQTRVGPADLGAVAAAQLAESRAREEDAWQGLNVEQCRRDQDAVACAAIQAFLRNFPNGQHAGDAQRILDELAGRPRTAPQVAVSPEDVARAAAAAAAATAAREAAEKAGKETCMKKCASSCKKDAACAKICVEEACQ
jgi:hypothetical protein